SSDGLGIYVAYANRLGPMEVVDSNHLAAAVAIIPITSHIRGREHPIWIVHSFDRVRTLLTHKTTLTVLSPHIQTGIEPDDTWFNDLQEELDEQSEAAPSTS
ncbi:hypothetical protein BD311DRAFT_662682, partial [Dichomitus squalens]